VRFLDDLTAEQYGYQLMKATGYPSGKIHQLLARLRSAGWIERLDNPDADPTSGGPPRITYRLYPEAVPMARRLVASAQAELSASTRTTRGPVAEGAW
jgi:PadR family transcriptional regulator PadR